MGVWGTAYGSDFRTPMLGMRKRIWWDGWVVKVHGCGDGGTR